MRIFGKRKNEERADPATEPAVDDVLLKALLGSPNEIDRQKALNIPSLKGCVEYIANMISMLPIKLYRYDNGSIEEVKNDTRVDLLNDDTGDTLDAVQFWRAIVADYFLGKGGYAYLHREQNRFTGVFYVDEAHISIEKNTDPIFKDFIIRVQGKPYWPYEFLKILRNTKNGGEGISLIEESPEIMAVAYNSLIFEKNLVAKGGNKKGFIKSAKKLTEEAMTILKAAWKKLYSNNSENVMVLNEGLDFQESSNTSVEMQLNENKMANSAEICKLVNVPESIIKGTATSQDHANGFRQAVMPVIRAIECALNRDYLLEKEKKSESYLYWAFDTKEVTRGDIKSRYEAYKAGIEAHFLQVDEVRFMEDLPALGLDQIILGLDSVLFDPRTKEIYTPNTGQTGNLGNPKPKGGEEDNEN